MSQQQAGNLLLAFETRIVQRCRPFRPGSIGIGAGLQQDPDNIQLAAQNRLVQRRRRGLFLARASRAGCSNTSTTVVWR